MKAVQRFITVMIWLCSFVITAVSILSKFDESLIRQIAFAAFGISVIVTIIYFLPMNERVKAIIVLCMVAFGCLSTSLAAGGSTGAFPASFIVLAMACLYFDPVILIVFNIIYLPFPVILYLIDRKYIIGPIQSSMLGSFELFVYFIISSCLYIGTKTGNKYILQAKADDEQAREKAAVLEVMSQSAVQKLHEMNHKISLVDDTVEKLVREAEYVNEDTKALNQAEETTMSMFQTLTEQIQQSKQSMDANVQIIDSMKQNFTAAKKRVEEGTEYSNHTKVSLEQIKEAILHADEYLLRSSIEVQQIVSMIERIDEIASRTNLLATNAAIEAARVGDKGQGFHIVAEQIRALSVQSKSSSEQVKVILKQLNEAMNNAEMKVKHGLNVIEQGIGSLHLIMDGLEMMDSYSVKAHVLLADEVETFAKITDEFILMVQNVDQSMQAAEENMQGIIAVRKSCTVQKEQSESAYRKVKEMNTMAGQLKSYFETVS